MEDSEYYTELRKKLIVKLRNNGIVNRNVLNAIGRVHRHLFINPMVSSDRDAYKDIPLPIGEKQTISQPYTVAYQTELLEVNDNDKILEVGTGSGYQSAVLAEMGATVYSIERQKKLYAVTKPLLSRLGYNQVKVFYGDGYQGLPEFAPFDKIIVTAAAPGIPAKLIDQLKIGGMMVIPVDGQIQKMLRITKTSATETSIEEFGEFRFVPLLSGKSE